MVPQIALPCIILVAHILFVEHTKLVQTDAPLTVPVIVLILPEDVLKFPEVVVMFPEAVQILPVETKVLPCTQVPAIIQVEAFMLPEEHSVGPQTAVVPQIVGPQTNEPLTVPVTVLILPEDVIIFPEVVIILPVEHKVLPCTQLPAIIQEVAFMLPVEHNAPPQTDVPHKVVPQTSPCAVSYTHLTLPTILRV